MKMNKRKRYKQEHKQAKINGAMEGWKEIR